MTILFWAEALKKKLEFHIRYMILKRHKALEYTFNYQTNTFQDIDIKHHRYQIFGADIPQVRDPMTSFTKPVTQQLFL
jgi:hypothetical protein